MQIGIDKISFQTTNLFLDLSELARARDVDPNKYLIGIGQEKQAVVPPTQDIVTLGAAATEKLLSDEDKAQLSTLIVATESGVDQSKAAAIYIKKLLGLDNFVRTIELKEACYSATAGLQFARGLVNLHPEEKVLVIAADIARYGLKTSGEVTQGAGAVAMLVSADPKVLAFKEPSVFYSDDIMDFWRPNYASEAVVDGKYSTNVYIDFFQQTWQRYCQKTNQGFDDFDSIVFHLPFTKMGKKALEAALNDRQDAVATRLRERLFNSQLLSRQVGNLYTGSLYLSLLSLITNVPFAGGEQIGLFSYGSGAEGEFFVGEMMPSYLSGIVDQDIKNDLSERKQVSVQEYEKLFNAQLGMSSESVNFELDQDHSQFVLTGLKNQQRLYARQF
ncbi:hydroxymethylglutaryl-CoA synthase [Paucilactobacillus sp. N302-9]